MFKISIELNFLGFNEIINELEKIIEASDMDNINKKIIVDVSEKIKNEIKPKITRSKDNSKSGKRGHRPSGHYADNIPTSNIKKKKGAIYVVIGEENDSGEYFYWKFKEFGTSKIPPCPVFGPAREKAQKMLDILGINEYSKLLQKKLDGR